MMKTTTKLLRSGAGLPIAVCLSLLGTACASKTSVSSDWLDKSTKRGQFDSALIVTVAANVDSRRNFEAAVAEDLRQPGTEIWAISTLIDPKTEINEKMALEVARKQQADAVIVTRVARLEVEPVEVAGRSKILAQEQQSGSAHVFRRKKGTLFQYEYDEDIESTYVTSEYTIELTTDVYDAASGEIIYTVIASAEKLETVAEVIDLLSEKIAGQLRKDRVIK